MAGVPAPSRWWALLGVPGAHGEGLAPPSMALEVQPGWPLVTCRQQRRGCQGQAGQWPQARQALAIKSPLGGRRGQEGGLWCGPGRRGRASPGPQPPLRGKSRSYPSPVERDPPALWAAEQWAGLGEPTVVGGAHDQEPQEGGAFPLGPEGL